MLIVPKVTKMALFVIMLNAIINIKKGLNSEGVQPLCFVRYLLRMQVL